MASSLEELEGGLLSARLVAIVRLSDHTRIEAIVQTLVEGGVRYLEITVERAEGLAALGRGVAAVGDAAVVGAGTVLSSDMVERVAELGARFVVAPNVNAGVIHAAHGRGLLALPGAYTPSEVQLAVEAGARLVKLFPASTGGEAYLRALRGPFPNVKFVPTGGVSIENAAEWFAAGAAAVALGSNLVPTSGSVEGLVDRTRRAVAASSATS